MKLSLLSKYRTHIMGLAMLWVMYFHSIYSGQDAFVAFIHRIGYYGVDIFLLVSGLGLYYSMRKCEKSAAEKTDTVMGRFLRTTGSFYLKRAVRILPAYLVITICWYSFYKTDVGTGDTILSILGINYFRGSIYGRPPYFDWFIPTLIVFYLITPLYDRLFQRVESKWKLTLLASCISPLLCIVSYNNGTQVLWGTFVRIPVFLVGYCIGHFLYEKKEETKGSWMVFLAMFISGITLVYYIENNLKEFSTIFWGLNCYPALLAAPAIAAFVGVFCLYMEKILKTVGKVLLLPLYICGRYSLEIYLIHQRLMEILGSENFTSIRESIKAAMGQPGYNILLMLITIALAALLHELITAVENLIRSLINKNKKPQPETAATGS